MENASQALIMAGGILIAIIIISMGVYLFSQAAELPKTYSENLEQERLQAFNNKFEVYYNEEKKENISAQDIVTVINMAADANKEYTQDEESYIKVYLDGNIINNYTEEQKINLMENANISSFRCEKIAYNPTSGKINCIKFVKK